MELPSSLARCAGVVKSRGYADGQHLEWTPPITPPVLVILETVHVGIRYLEGWEEVIG